MAVSYRIVLQAHPAQVVRLDKLLRDCGAVRVESPRSGYLVGYGPHQLIQLVRERVPGVVLDEEVWTETETQTALESTLLPGRVVMVTMPEGWPMTGLLERVRDGQADVLMLVFDHPRRVTVAVEHVHLKPLPEPWA